MQDIRFATIRRFNPSDMIYTDSIRIVMMQVEAMFFRGSPSGWKEHLTTKTEQLETGTISDRIFSWAMLCNFSELCKQSMVFFSEASV